MAACPSLHHGHTEEKMENVNKEEKHIELDEVFFFIKLIHDQATYMCHAHTYLIDILDQS